MRVGGFFDSAAMLSSVALPARHRPRRKRAGGGIAGEKKKSYESLKPLAATGGASAPSKPAAIDNGWHNVWREKHGAVARANQAVIGGAELATAARSSAAAQQ